MKQPKRETAEEQHERERRAAGMAVSHAQFVTGGGPNGAQARERRVQTLRLKKQKVSLAPIKGSS